MLYDDIGTVVVKALARTILVVSGGCTTKRHIGKKRLSAGSKIRVEDAFRVGVLRPGQWLVVSGLAQVFSYIVAES